MDQQAVFNELSKMRNSIDNLNANDKQLKVLYNIYINNIASIELELMTKLKSLTKPLKLESLIKSVKDD